MYRSCNEPYYRGIVETANAVFHPGAVATDVADRERAEKMLAGSSGTFREILHYLESETAPDFLAAGSGRSARTDIRKRICPAGETIADDRDDRQATLLVVSGWVASGKELPDGSRTVVDFSFAGDVLTFGAMEWSRETVHAMTSVTMFEFPGALYESLSTCPRHVREFMLKGIARRYARMTEHVVNVSRRGAVERVAHLLLELSCRIGVRDDGNRASFACPLTQVDLGDALGLSVVHVNRVLRKLREGGYVTFRDGVVEFTDRRRLADMAKFDSAYLAPRS